VLASINANDLAAFAVFGGFLLTVGAGIGRKWGSTKKQRAAQLLVEKAAETTVQQLTYAVTGKPADQWGPREPGLIEQMAKSREDLRSHAAEDLKVASAFHERLRAVEVTSTAAAEALALGVRTTASALADRAGSRDISPEQYAKLIALLDKSS
jgi:hypothetical protein